MYTAPLKAAFLFLALGISTLAAPRSPSLDRRANVLTTQTYNQFQVSGGVAGNALAEVNAKFPVRALRSAHPPPQPTPSNPIPLRSTNPTSPPSRPATSPSSPRPPRSPRTPRSTRAASTTPSRPRAAPRPPPARPCRSARSRTRC